MSLLGRKVFRHLSYITTKLSIQIIHLIKTLKSHIGVARKYLLRHDIELHIFKKIVYQLKSIRIYDVNYFSSTYLTMKYFKTLTEKTCIHVL